MTITKALNMVVDQYERAKKMEHIHNPLAYALYKVWKVADSQGNCKNDTLCIDSVNPQTKKALEMMGKKAHGEEIELDYGAED